MSGRQCFSLSPNSVLILLIDVSWCGEYPKRDLMNLMWQNLTVRTRAQSWFGQALASTSTNLYIIENGALMALRYCNGIHNKIV